MESIGVSLGAFVVVKRVGDTVIREKIWSCREIEIVSRSFLSSGDNWHGGGELAKLGPTPVKWGEL